MRGSLFVTAICCALHDMCTQVFWCQSISINACKVWHQLPRESSQLHSMEIPNLRYHQSMLRLRVPCLMIRMISTMISTIIWNKWNHNTHLFVGDFNTRVGLDSHSIHPEVIGCHCFYDTTNNNSERLVDLCEEFKLCPAQMRFPHPRHSLPILKKQAYI